MSLDSSVSFLLLVCRNELMWFLYLSLKLVASPTYDSVVVAVVLLLGRPRLLAGIFLQAGIQIFFGSCVSAIIIVA